MADPKITMSADIRFLLDGVLLLGQMGCDLNYKAALADTTMTPDEGEDAVATSVPTFTDWDVPLKGYVHTGTGGMGSILAKVGDRSAPIVAKVEMGNPTVEYYTGSCWLQSCKMAGTDLKGAAKYDLQFIGTGPLTRENVGP